MTPPLFVLAYPRLSERERAWIDAIRDRHDAAAAGMVAPHFTLVFGTRRCAADGLAAHVAHVARSRPPIAFHCRRTVVHPDAASERWLVYLVPDEGSDAISEVFDALHAGPLAAELRRDLPFVPHVTIGALPTRAAAEELAAGLAAEDISIAGSIDQLCVIEVSGGRIRDLSSHRLQGPGASTRLG